jgi:hypothetical protein
MHDYATGVSALRLRWCGAWLRAGLLWVAVLAVAMDGADPVDAEYRLKAAVLFNLAKFTEWPAAGMPGAGAPWRVGLLGVDRFGGAIDELAKTQVVQGHPVAIRRLESLGELRGCHVLFIGRSETGRLAEVLAALGDAPVLTVSEAPQTAERGVMINLVMKDEMVRFEINLRAAERAGLRVSSKVLKYATLVTSRTATDTPQP